MDGTVEMISHHTCYRAEIIPILILVLLSPLHMVDPFAYGNIPYMDSMSKSQYGPAYAHDDESIHVLNPQSYPYVGQTWDVIFETSGGPETLKIYAINGTLLGHDLEFLSLESSDEIWNATIHENYVEFSNYVGSGTATFGVLTSGKHHLRFEYGDSVSFAHNDASIVSLSIMSNNSDSLNVVSPGEILEITVMLNENIAHKSFEITGASSKHLPFCGNSCFHANAHYADLTFYEDPSNLALDGSYITFNITLTTEFGNIVRLTESDFNIPSMLLSTLKKTNDSSISIAPAGSVSKNILGFTTGSETRDIEIIRHNSSTYALISGIDTTLFGRIYKFIDVSYIDDPILKLVHTATESYAQGVLGITALNFSNEFPAFSNHTFLYVIRDSNSGSGRETAIVYNITDPLHPNYAGGQFPGAYVDGTVGLESIYHDTYGSIVIQLSNSYDGFIDIIFLDYIASQNRFFTDAPLSTTIDNDYGQYVNDTNWRGLETVVIDDKPYMLALSGSNTGEMHIIDLSNPQYPQWDSIVVNGTDNFTMLGRPSDVKIKTIHTDTFAFVASSSDGGIQIINITNSTNPIAAGTLGANIPGFPNISGINITNLESPYLVASITDDQNNYTTLNDPTDIEIVRISSNVYAMITSKTDYGASSLTDILNRT